MQTATDYKALAADAAGNWQRFNSFAWFSKPDNADDFTIVYVSNRDSDTLDKANAKVIADELTPFIKRGTVIPQRHSHWACGHVDGYAIKVRDKRGRITKAFQVWADIQARLDDYPILDESLYSEMELEAQNESWECWARADYVRAVERALDVTLDDSDASAVLTAFEAARERSNTEWDSDSIDVERIAQATEFDDVRALIVPLVATIFENGKVMVRGTITGDDYACEVGLYQPEFADCMEAWANGLDSLTIGEATFTWEVC